MKTAESNEFDHMANHRATYTYLRYAWSTLELLHSNSIKNNNSCLQIN